MSIILEKVINIVAGTLHDPQHIRWTKPELILWFNAGQREIVTYKPNAFVKTVAVDTIAGTHQTMPPDCNAFIRITRNMGADGVTEGNAIRVVSQDLLDAQNPAWHLEPATGSIKHYMFSEVSPKDYYVYPRSNGKIKIEMVYSAVPEDVADGETSALDVIYEEALVNYMLYRAYSKDADYALNGDLAAKYYTVFTSILGGRTAGEASV